MTLRHGGGTTLLLDARKAGRDDRRRWKHHISQPQDCKFACDTPSVTQLHHPLILKHHHHHVIRITVFLITTTGFLYPCWYNLGFELHCISTVSMKELKSQQCKRLFLLSYQRPHHLHEFHIFRIFLLLAYPESSQVRSAAKDPVLSAEVRLTVEAPSK